MKSVRHQYIPLQTDKLAETPIQVVEDREQPKMSKIGYNRENKR